VALLRHHAPEHPWVQRAAGWCWEQIHEPLPHDQYQVHAIAEFLLSEPDQARSRPLLDALGDSLAAGRVVPIDPAAPPASPDTHTPLHFATTPDHPLRRFFGDAILEGFLQRLAAEQRDDGGWPIDWPAPGTTAIHEWRAIRTLEALATLRAWGRL
jgi:hypothetical protein